MICRSISLSVVKTWFVVMIGSAKLFPSSSNSSIAFSAASRHAPISSAPDSPPLISSFAKWGICIYQRKRTKWSVDFLHLFRKSRICFCNFITYIDICCTRVFQSNFQYILSAPLVWHTYVNHSVDSTRSH